MTERYDFFNTPQRRYDNDIHYRALVDMMHAQIAQCHFTPSEMREAAVLASIMYERMNIKAIVVPRIPQVIEECLKAVHDWEDDWRTKHVKGD